MKKQEIIDLKLRPTDKKDYYYLVIDEYILIFSFLRFQKLAILSSVTHKAELSTYLNRLMIHNDNVKRAYLSDHDLGIVISYRKLTSKQLEKILIDLIKTFRNLNIHTVDRFTKERGMLYPAFLSEDIEIVSRKSFASAKSAYKPPKSSLKGILSEIILLLASGLVFAYGHQLLILLIFSGLLFGLSAFYGYLLLGEVMDRKGMIVSFLVSLVMLMAAEGLSIALMIARSMNSSVKNKMSVSLADTIPLVPSFLADPDVLAQVAPVLIVMIVIIIVIMGICFWRYSKRHSKRGFFKIYD